MISDDDLILYYYRDGLDAAERARIGTALGEQPELAQRLQRLVAHLDAVTAHPDVPVPAGVQKRWQDALGSAAAKSVEGGISGRTRASRHLVPWFSAAMAAAVAVILIVHVATQSPPERVAEAVTPEVNDAGAYERGLKWHLASTERTLAGIGSATPEERARLIETIVAQNRIYALAAERAGEPQLARVLRAFAPILESLAHDGGETSASVAQLGFELRVMQGRLGAGTASSGDPSTTL
jgi:hypothetical protein